MDAREDEGCRGAQRGTLSSFYLKKNACFLCEVSKITDFQALTLWLRTEHLTLI
jgi:hypothetical protein